MGSPGSLVSPAGLPQLAEQLRDGAHLPFGSYIQVRRDLGRPWENGKLLLGRLCFWLLNRMLNSIKTGLSVTSLPPQRLRARTQDSAVAAQVSLLWTG